MAAILRALPGVPAAHVTRMAAVATLALAIGCRAAAPCDGVACTAACPRDAEPNGAGRCACVPGTLQVLGACVPPAVGDAYCGAAARASAYGCVLRSCAADEVLDAVTGACLSVVGRIDTASPSAACADGGVPAIAGGRSVCIEARTGCPRGTRRSGGTAGSKSECARPPMCPPGTLVDVQPLRGADAGGAQAACRPIVTLGVRDGIHRVDLGAWAALVFGVDGGEGTQDLCGPLSLRVDVFGLPEGQPSRVEVRIVMVAPDEDLTRVHARVDSELSTPAGDLPLSPEAAALVERSVSTLLEPLRSLGGEASTAAIKLGVSCPMRSL